MGLAQSREVCPGVGRSGPVAAGQSSHQKQIRGWHEPLASSVVTLNPVGPLTLRAQARAKAPQFPGTGNAVDSFCEPVTEQSFELQMDVER